ncbi:hypothetical protein DAPPUDRAFT_227378 [Daphnia pulex]|uniref:Tox-ART-HYD1 domain-containing protein n=1 Tax=Daphnia pulex TaxID=6669 RepID=E9H6H6_DAPPU|nr:hypothetical protein DAPPUDRAFT_227378 [Daphnia pulex]|eukprot:EFX72661.1 hypothetical protein DAPPUDRAFT_227378 [Daphnia pulex]
MSRMSICNFLYHYTNEENFNKILDEKILRVSLRGRHGRFGTGVYLTSFTPDKGREAIKKNNRDGVSHLQEYADKTEECYLKFKKEDLVDVKNVQPKGHQQDIWLNSSDINLRDISYYSGYTDKSDEEEYHPCASVVASAEANVGSYENHCSRHANPAVSERQSAGRSTYGYGTGGDSRSISYRSYYQQQQQESESDSDGDYSWYPNPAVCERHQSAGRSTYGYGTGGDSRSTSFRTSHQQQQQESDEIGLGGVVAGTAAVLAVGAAAFGLFAAFRQSRQNNQQ